MVLNPGVVQRVRPGVRRSASGMWARPAIPPIPVMRYPIERRLLPTTQAVTAGGTAFLDLPLGVTYKRIHILYGGTTFDKTKMNNIRIIANGQVIHNLTGTERNLINIFDKLPDASTYKVLTIPFERINLRDGADEHTGLPTLMVCQATPRGIYQLRLEIDIDATAVAPTIEVIADVRANDKDLARMLLRVEKKTEVVPALAGVDYLFLQKYNGDGLRPLLHRMFLNQGDTEINRIKIQVDTKEIFNRAAKENEHVQALLGWRSPQSGWTVLDSSEDAYSRPWLVGHLSDHRIIINVAAGNYNLNCISETLGSLPA